ncbi:hypothetical protein [Arthrobacter koreensis]|uniref:hypothetical protein n=1 Tax=Arthrobacter koreensis TaxID=199136 RepID=UPI0037F51118
MEINSGIDLKTASERSGRTVRQLRSKIKTGELAAVKEGGKLYVRHEDLDALPDPKRSLEDHARKVVGGWPRLSDERTQELGRLLGPDRKPPGKPKFSAETDAAIDRIVAAAPPLSKAQREKLRQILGGDDGKPGSNRE